MAKIVENSAKRGGGSPMGDSPLKKILYFTKNEFFQMEVGYGLVLASYLKASYWLWTSQIISRSY